MQECGKRKKVETARKAKVIVAPQGSSSRNITTWGGERKGGGRCLKGWKQEGGLPSAI